jgi:hypothetical protein
MHSAIQNKRTGDVEPSVRSQVRSNSTKQISTMIMDLYFKTCLGNLTLACDGLMCIIITLQMHGTTSTYRPPPSQSPKNG